MITDLEMDEHQSGTPNVFLLTGRVYNTIPGRMCKYTYKHDYLICNKILFAMND